MKIDFSDAKDLQIINEEKSQADISNYAAKKTSIIVGEVDLAEVSEEKPSELETIRPNKRVEKL